MRIVLGGYPVNEGATGPGVYARDLIRALLRRSATDDCSIHLTSRKARRLAEQTASYIDPTGRLSPRATPVPRKVLACCQQAFRLPTETMLVGAYDVYHQLHLEQDPGVPDHKLVVTVHDTVSLSWPVSESRLPRTARRTLRRARAVITVSEFSRQQILDTWALDPTRVIVAFNGIDHARFRATLDPADISRARSRHGLDAPYVLVLGGGTPRKNLPRAIEAFRAAREATRYPGLLAMAGPGSSGPDVLTAQRSDAGIVRLGVIPDADVPLLLAGSDALLYPSLYEGFGLPALEAQACRTTVVTSNGSALKEVAGEAAILVEPTDVDSIAAGLATALTEEAAARYARHDAGVIHAQRFTWANSADIHARVYRGVVEGTA